MNVPLLFDIFSPLTVRKPWMWTFAGRLNAGHVQHGRPEQRVEIRDVLADEVVDFGLRAAPPVVQLLALPPAPLQRRADVADRGVEPDVPVVAGAVGNLEAEVRRRPRNVPVVERLAEEVAGQVVGDFRLEVPAPLRPLFQERVQLLDVTNRWSALRISGFVPESVLTGSIRSAGL